MNFKRIFTVIISLVLVCCLLVNVSPIEANALGPFAATTVLISSGIVLASIFSGLGVSPVDEGAQLIHDTFMPIVNACSDFISLNYDWVTDDQKIAVWATGTDEMPFMIDQEVIEAVRDWLFTSETLVEETADYGFMYYDVYCLPEFTDEMLSYKEDGYTSYFLAFSNGTYRIYFSNVVPTAVENGRFQFVAPFKYCYFRWNSTYPDSWIYDGGSSHSSGTITMNGPFLWCNVFDGEPSDTYTLTAEDYLTLNYIAPSSEDLTAGYSDWAAGAISIPNTQTGEEDICYPIAIGDSAESTALIPQTDVWKGLSTVSPDGPIQPTDPPEDPDEQLITELTTVGLLAMIRDLHIMFIKDLLGIGNKTLGEMLTDLKDSITDFGDKIGEKIIEPIKDAFADIGESITDVIAPDEDYLSKKIEETRERFSFVDSLMKTGSDLKEFFSTVGVQPPIIYIDLNSTRGSYDFGDKVPFIDLTWYSEYKPTMDKIISAFLWLTVIWNLLILAPGVISGASGLPGTRDTIPENIHTWSGFSRQTSEQYERSSMQNRRSNNLDWGIVKRRQ